jgi:hypothetical protein
MKPLLMTTKLNTVARLKATIETERRMNLRSLRLLLWSRFAVLLNSPTEKQIYENESNGTKL